jgi:hypothetical protein
MRKSSILICIAAYIIYNKETHNNIEINNEINTMYEVKQNLMKIYNSESTDKINESCKLLINGKFIGSLYNIYAYGVIKAFDYIKNN